MLFRLFVLLPALVLGVYLPGIALPADLSAPLIDLPTVKPPTTPGAAFQIKAIVDDDSGVISVKMYYRLMGNKSNYKSLTLEPTKPNSKFYAVNLPAGVLKAQGIEYYVEARDLANNVTQEPFPNKPRKVYFRADKNKSRLEYRNSSSNTYYRKPEWGIAVSFGSYSVDDPDGNTGAVSTPGFSGIFSYAIARKLRVWTELSYQQFQLPYSQTNIGQDVRSTRLDLLLQWDRLPMVDSQGWVGAGVGIGFNSMKDRATSGPNGFVQDSFDDRSGTNLSIILDLGYKIGVIRNKMTGIHGRIYRSLNNDLEGINIGFYITFR